MATELASESCLSNAEENAVKLFAQSATWQSLCCTNPFATLEQKIQAAKLHIWADEFNPHWVEKRPIDIYNQREDFFPLLVIDSGNHNRSQLNNKESVGGDISAWIALRVPREHERHQFNARRWITNHIDTMLKEVVRGGEQIGQLQKASRHWIGRNAFEDWAVDGRVEWWCYVFPWGDDES